MNGNIRSWTNGLPAYAGTQRNPPAVGVRPGAVHFHNHVAHTNNRGKHDTSGTAQEQGRGNSGIGKAVTSRPQRELHGNTCLPCGTTQQQGEGVVGKQSLLQPNNEGVPERLDRRDTHEAVGVQGLLGLRANIRGQEGLLFPVRWTPCPPGYDLRSVRARFNTQPRRETLAYYSQSAKPPFFVYTLAGRDDGFSSQPERVATAFPDTGESGDTYNAEQAAVERGFIDHVSRETAVAYDYGFTYSFGWTARTRWCERCGRSIHIWVSFDRYKHRICRAHLSPEARELFELWVLDQW